MLVLEWVFVLLLSFICYFITVLYAYFEGVEVKETKRVCEVFTQRQSEEL